MSGDGNDSTSPVVKASLLSKAFGGIKAVRELDIQINSGIVHGFLGPNGAGKTTVIKILLGLISPDSGEVNIFGLDLFRERNRIMKEVGAVVESPLFFEYMTAYENLHYLSSLSGGSDRKSIGEALDIVGLANVAARKVGSFSYGMKQRLGIAQSLLPKNRFIVLDEPTNGLDPHGIAGMRRLIRKLCEEHGVTIFISSHLLSEVEQICDYVTIIDRGMKICEAKVSDLVSRRERIELRTPDGKAFRSFARNKNMEIHEESREDELEVFIFSGHEKEIPKIIEQLSEHKIRILGICRHSDTLEDIFIELTGNNKTDFTSDRF